MKKTMRTFLLCGALAALLCVSALAAKAPENPGIKNLTADEVTAVLYDADGTAVNKVTDAVDAKNQPMDSFYPLAEKVEITYSDAQEGKFYAVFLLAGESAVPTETNLKYIDQVQAGADGVTFTVYPAELAKGDGEYTVYLSSNATSGIDTLTAVASFSYYEPPKLALGDIDGDTEITPDDASYVLQIAVGLPGFTEEEIFAADVDKDEEVTPDDASYVLQFAVGLITDFTSVQ